MSIINLKDVVQDFEIQAWAEEIESEQGGNLKGFREGESISSVKELVTLVTDIIWTVTAKHSAGNAGQWEYFG